MVGAHPRSRGENAGNRWKSGGPRGSSPLTRGKLLPVISGLLGQGLIPAHAGKTPPSSLEASLHGAHPRSRGENAYKAYNLARRRGSSPLTRGKREHGPAWVAGVGLIPAHAGKTRVTMSGSSLRGAHPRSRGENSKSLWSMLRIHGSSPLTRGKSRGAGLGYTGPGLIPAHAGKIRTRRGSRLRSEAHPRSRGENRAEIAAIQTRAGSSPLTRGKCEGGRGLGDGERLIPAHAGKIRTAIRSRRSIPAHPRSRGENAWSAHSFRNVSGSSPLTRGKSITGGWCNDAAGLIPAHAGKMYAFR